jgi:hypothetical protein
MKHILWLRFLLCQERVFANDELCRGQIAPHAENINQIADRASLACLLGQAFQIFGFELGFELSSHYTTSFSQLPTVSNSHPANTEKRPPYHSLRSLRICHR